MTQEIQNLQLLASAQRKLRSLEMREAVDPLDPMSRPTAGQLEVFKSLSTYRKLYVFGGNRSGKSMIGGRTAAYFLERDCPYFDFDSRWPGKPLLILIVARTSEHYTEIWEKKIQPFLTPGSFKEEKTGGVLQRVRNKKNGGKMIFLTYHNPYEAREKAQMFGADFVLLDEQTDHLPLLEELIRRTSDSDGIFMNTMTPKIPSPAVKKYIEKPHRQARIFKLKMLDNPAFKGREQDILDDIRNLPPEMQATILEGDWYQDEGKVYLYDQRLHQDTPIGYSFSWKHSVAVDPAASGKVGFIVAAENPRTGKWYLVKAKYLRGEAPTDLLDKITEETVGLNVQHRVSDPHETWFVLQAAKPPYRQFYQSVHKDGRKNDLVKGVSEALKAGWLKVTPGGCVELEDELSEAQWSSTKAGHIHNSTKFHLLDALQYFVDTKPKFVPSSDNLDVYTLLDLSNRARKKSEAAKVVAKKKKLTRLRPAFGGRSRR